MRTWIGAIAVVATTTTAMAADFPRSNNYYTAAAPLRSYSWAGPYLGATAGYEWGNVTNSSTKPAGLAGGIEAGYNWQVGQFVFGGETDINLSGADDTFAPWQVLQSLVRNSARAGRHCVQQCAAVRHRGRRLRQPPRRDRRPDRVKHRYRLDGRPRHRGRLHAQLVGQGRVALPRLSDHTYSLTGVSNGLQANLLRFGVNYHF